MRFPTPLRRGRLLRRWNRFLCEVALDDGDAVVAHCPNPGSMMGLSEPGLSIWVEPNDDARRKLGYAWRLVELPQGHLAGIDTMVPNRVVAEALAAGSIPGFDRYPIIRPEVPYGTRSRVDFHLSGADGPPCWLEVKNVHLRREDDWAEFPDCVTTRGARHLDDLAARAAQSDRAAMLFVVQRTDCARFRLAADLDPGYADAFARAQAAGVEMHCFATRIDVGGVTLGRSLPVLQ